MKDEIKEILDELESMFEISEAPEHIINEFNKVKDYITNLQEELNATLKNYGNLVKEWKILQQENERLAFELNKNMIERNNFLSKNEKAIEYIKEHTLYSFDLYDEDDVNSYFEKASPKDLLNILQGSDE